MFQQRNDTERWAAAALWVTEGKQKWPINSVDTGRASYAGAGARRTWLCC